MGIPPQDRRTTISIENEANKKTDVPLQDRRTTTSSENGANRRTDVPLQVEKANILGFEILGEQSQQKNKCNTTR